MNNLTILMVLHNEVEYAELSLQSIRLFADVPNLSVVMVDNHSDAAFGEWAKMQDDITYIYIDEGVLPFGQVVNKVQKEMQIEDDLLIMDAHYLLTPHALSRLQAELYHEDTIGAVGGKSNSFLFYQAETGIDNYEAAVKWADRKNTGIQGQQVLLLHSGAILLRSSMISQLGDFDEELISQEYVMRDYCFRMITNDWKQCLCHDSFFWDMRGNGPYHSKYEAEYALLENKWGMHYFQTMYNENIIDMIIEDVNAPVSVLEIGCDCGATLLEIKNRYPNAAVYGSELNEKSALIASHVACVKANNIEEQTLDFSPQTFDYIIFGDVLEHLHNPLKTIQYCRKFLKKNGYILASIPNLMHISVIEKLLQGDFTYTETGLLDKTHIHFFTYNEIIKLFEAGGYKIDQIGTVASPISAGQKSLIDKLLELQAGASSFMYEAFWYIVRAQY